MDTATFSPDKVASDPNIRINVNLDDLGLWEPLSLETGSEKPTKSPLSKKILPKTTVFPIQRSPARGSGTRDRPKLVTPDDFQNSLVNVAQSIILSRKSVHAVVKETDDKSIASSSPVNRPQLGMSPLIKAFHRVVQENEKFASVSAEVPPVPTGPVISLVQEPTLPPGPLVSEVHQLSVPPAPLLPDDLHLQDAPSPHKDTMVLETFYDNTVEPSQRYHWTTQAFNDASSDPVPVPRVTTPVALSSRDQLRLVRILENISSRKIWNAWLRFKKRRKPDPFKEQLRSMVMAALSNSKLIREELKNIREQLSHSVVEESKLEHKNIETQVTRANTPSKTPKVLTPDLHVSNQPMFKSARILIAPSVQSPVMMDQLLDDLTTGIGRSAVRMCSAQQSLHPKAFVIVLSTGSVTVEEWKSRIINCYYIYAWDSAFPLFQTTTDRIPWEVRVRNDMNIVAPVWTLTGAHTIYNSSGG